jgi:D-galactarolactone cycloisomerase
LCAAEHLRISPHVWGTGIGLAAAVHFVASLPNYPHGAHVPYPPLVEYDVGRNGLQNGIFVEPIHYADGHLNVPKGPGLGVTLDEAGVRQFIPA